MRIVRFFGIFSSLVISFFGLAPISQADVASDIQDLPSNTWYRIPNSNLSAVYYDWSPDPIPTGGSQFQNGIMDQWAGGVYDSVGNRLLVSGGGHNGYWGNEWYGFDLGTFTWSVVIQPSDYDTIMGEIYTTRGRFSDGRPIADHSLNNRTFVPSLNSIWMVNNSGDEIGPSWPRVTSYNFNTSQYIPHEDNPYGVEDAEQYDTVALDPNTDHIWVYTRFRHLWEYIPSTDTWYQRTSVQENTGNYSYVDSIEVDPVNKRLVLVGDGDYLNWDIDPAHLIPNGTGGCTQPAGCVPEPIRTYTCTSGSECSGGEDGPVFADEFSEEPTLVYDPTSGKILSWLGVAGDTRRVYVLDAATHTWSSLVGNLYNNDSSNTPTIQNDNGDFGRVRFIPSLNVLLKVSRTTDDIYVYRYFPTATDITPPTVTGFSIPTTSASQNVSITTFTAYDNSGVTGYLINESASTPSVSDPN